MPEIQITHPQEQDIAAIFSLYQAVAAIEGGLARTRGN